MQRAGILPGMSHNEWVHATTAGDSARRIARTAGLPPRSVANWADKNRFPAEAVIGIAVAYGAHPVGALVATGYLDAKYAEQVDPVTVLRTISEDALADEVLRRMKLGQGAGVFDVPLDELTQADFDQAAPLVGDVDDTDDHDWDV